ncbi:hypothetical protein Hamer_G029270, partial [Homarus americanus]
MRTRGQRVEVIAATIHLKGGQRVEVIVRHDTLSEDSVRNYTDKELINDMIVPLLHQWTKANALFKPPVINQCRTIELKLTKLWHKAVETSLGKGNLARKNEFLHTLDTLFDILTCKCSIQLCSESNCSHSGKRENNSHIDCGCPREKKIPVLELEFIKAQRTKAEGQGSMQMGSIDYSETKKQIANAKKREQIREREQKKKMKSEEAIQREEELCQDVYHFFDIPPINVNATKLSELVDLSLEVLEPPLTTSLTSQELRNLKETPMQVPKWPSHTQSVERCVKMVTEAAGHVYSHERREGINRKNKHHVKYPDVPSAIKPVPHGPGIPIPTPPENYRDMILDDDHDIDEDIEETDASSTYLPTASAKEPIPFSQAELNDLTRD